jgi:hypothetical protein
MDYSITASAIPKFYSNYLKWNTLGNNYKVIYIYKQKNVDNRSIQWQINKCQKKK